MTGIRPAKSPDECRQCLTDALSSNGLHVYQASDYFKIARSVVHFYVLVNSFERRDDGLFYELQSTGDSIRALAAIDPAPVIYRFLAYCWIVDSAGARPFPPTAVSVAEIAAALGSVLSNLAKGGDEVPPSK